MKKLSRAQRKIQKAKWLKHYHKLLKEHKERMIKFLTTMKKLNIDEKLKEHLFKGE